MLKPETSSDSPSAKSNGVRLVSAREMTSHRPKRNGNSRRFLIIELFWEIDSRFIEELESINTSSTRANLTSYEIVWAIPRREPMRA